MREQYQRERLGIFTRDDKMLATTPEVFETETGPSFPNAGRAVDDLRKCISHGAPINRCRACWPAYLRILSAKCAAEIRVIA